MVCNTSCCWVRLGDSGFLCTTRIPFLSTLKLMSIEASPTTTKSFILFCFLLAKDRIERLLFALTDFALLTVVWCVFCDSCIEMVPALSLLGLEMRVR